MQREKLLQAMARRNQRKDQEAEPGAQVTFSSMSVDEVQQSQTSFAAQYLDSRQLGTTANVKTSSIAMGSSKADPAYEQQGNGESFHELDKNLADLQSQFESYASVSPKRKANSDQRVTASRRIQGSQLDSSTSQVMLDDRGSFDEQTSYISVPGDSAPDVQYKASPPKDIPKPQSSNIKTLQQQVKQQEQLIQQLQTECNRLTIANRELQQNVPADDQERKVLIQKMRAELINARDMLAKQEDMHNAAVKELTEQLEMYQAQERDHSEIIGAVNQIVTGQNKAFDFEALVAVLKSKFQKATEDAGPGADYYIKRLRESTEDMRALKEVVAQKDSELLKLQCKFNALELQLQSQAKMMSQKSAQPQSKTPLPSGAPVGFKQELQQRDQEIQRLKQELADTRALAANTDPMGTQDVFRDQLRQTQQVIQQMSFKQQAQEEEYQRRLQAFTENEQQTLARIRDGYETRLKDMGLKLEDAENKRRQADELSTAWQRRFEKLNQQYEQEQMSELQKRISQLEQQPPSQALKDVMERVVKAENQLDEERRQFKLVCKEKTIEIAEYKAQLMEILQAITQMGV